MDGSQPERIIVKKWRWGRLAVAAVILLVLTLLLLFGIRAALHDPAVGLRPKPVDTDPNPDLANVTCPDSGCGLSQCADGEAC